MTQAPTPGPLSDDWTPWNGGPRPHPPGTVVRVRYRNGSEDEGKSAFARWWHDKNEPERDIIAFRLAPTAPVEASGSEREDTFKGDDNALVESITTLLDLPDSALSHRVPGLAKQLLASAANRLSTRPQPSGETREAVARIVDPFAFSQQCRSDAAKRDSGEHSRGKALTKADTILALLSARPLALGGQHSGGDWNPADGIVGPLSCLEEVADAHWSGDDALDRIQNFARRELDAALSTPARAEAQDEGAAGYSVALLASYCGDDTSGCTDKTPCLDCVKMANVYKVPKSALGEFVGELGNIAAPSPTPAADEDRVLLEQWVEVFDGLGSGSGPLINTTRARIAILKSTVDEDEA